MIRVTVYERPRRIFSKALTVAEPTKPFFAFACRTLKNKGKTSKVLASAYGTTAAEARAELDIKLALLEQ